ncbi:fatty acyl-CoA reductase wat [Cephus cinctus]|uniref:Fatty acyl-CoA reductase n=1 Tax=Cephus cinctus TaxID=211228 RepID=A0AAJ7BZX0_CEPCN|nr:fatty acyl-CoA reductase wat [Cephus cinctus]
MDEVYKRINDDTEMLDTCTDASEIEQFYAGQCVFLTGSTGFIGKSVVEKLLRTCANLKKLYILVRAKKGSSPTERLKKYLKDDFFNELRKTVPDFEKKIVLIEGDLSENGIGLSIIDRHSLIEEVNIVVHNAANVKFDIKVELALRINVLGTQSVLDLVSQCKNIKAFVYVSTAYSNCIYTDIEEKFYPSPADLKMVNDMIKADLETPNGINKAALKMLLGDIPNIYVFSKATAENFVKDYSKKVNFPCAVFRPSIVASTYKEPVAGWCGNLNGPAAGIIGYALGIIHTVFMTDSPIDLVPVDMCANALIAIPWYIVDNKKEEKTASVFNYGTSVTNPINVKACINWGYTHGSENPSIKMVWDCFIITTSNYWLWLFLEIFLHFIPAIIADVVLLTRGKKPMAVNGYFKIVRYFGIVRYFLNGIWRIHVTEMQKLWDRLKPHDKKKFHCDLREIDWMYFSSLYWNGLRVYILKEPMDTVPIARKRFARLRLYNKILFIFLSLLLIYTLNRFIRYICI